MKVIFHVLLSFRSKIKKDKMVQFGISQKSDGQMIARKDNFAIENRKRYFSKVGVDFNRIIFASLQHGNRVTVVDKSYLGKTISPSDALVTDKENICLAVTVSDCVPLFFYNKKGVVGIAHAGWRGVVLNISGEVVKIMREKFSLNPKNIKVYIGPHLKKCHFEVQQDVLDKFKDYLHSIERKDGRIFISLEAILKKQLHNVGIPSENIETSPDCTHCSGKYFSFRRDKPKSVTSQVAYIKKGRSFVV